MSTENTTQTQRKRSTRSAAAAANTDSAPAETVVQKTSEATPAVKPTYKVRTTIDPTAIITVLNGFQGKLIYKSQKTGERFVWEDYGDPQDMEFQELKYARNASKKFFVNNWFMFEDPAVIDALGVGQYYRYATSIEDLDDLFQKPADELDRIISPMSNSQKQSIAYRAKQLITDGVIDSIKTITNLENLLHVELIER